MTVTNTRVVVLAEPDDSGDDALSPVPKRWPVMTPTRANELALNSGDGWPGRREGARPLGIEVRASTDADREDVAALIREMVPGHDVSARLAWLHERNPAGRALTWLAFAGRELAGCTSLFPYRLTPLHQPPQLVEEISKVGSFRSVAGRRGGEVAEAIAA